MQIFERRQMSEERPTVLVDMDGVLADFDKATQAHLLENHPEILIKPRRHFYFREDYPDPNHQAVIDELHSSQGFFESLPVMDGAEEAWEHIADLGYKPQVCTSPLRSNEWCAEEKLSWLQRNFGKTAARTAIISSDKANYDGIALIDDKTTIKNADQASWQHILFAQSHNLDADAKFRLDSWRDPDLEEILAVCHMLYRKP